MAVDLDAMAGKAGLKDGKGQQVLDKVTAALKGGLEGDAAKLAERIINEPKESGLSFTDKVYLFATPHANAFGILAKVDNKGKLEDLLKVLKKEQICSDIKEESGCRWTQMGQALCAFNNGTFLVMQNKSGDAENIKGTLFMLMRQKDGEGYASVPGFAEVKQTGNDIASVIDLSILSDNLIAPLRMGLSGDIRLQDIKYLITTNFEQGRIVITSRSLTQNEKVKTFYAEMDKVTSNIQGKYLDYFPANTLAWFGGNFHGKAFYDMLRQNPAIRQALDNPMLPVDVERIFSSVEGDYAMGFNSLLNNDFLMYADVTNASFLETFEELRPLLALTGGQIQLFDTAENQYALKTMQGIYWFGVKNNRLYVTNRRELAEEAGRTYGVSVGTRPWAGAVKENRMFASFNFQKLMTDVKANPYLLSPLGSQQAATVFKALVGECDCMNISMPDWSQGKVEIVLKDKQANALQLVVQMINNL